MKAYDLTKLFDPILDMFDEFRRELKAVQKTLSELVLREPPAGPPGPPPNLDDVCKTLITNYPDAVKGERGERGAEADAKQIADNVLELVINNERARGPKGDSPAPELVADALFKEYGEMLRGLPGKDAEPHVIEIKDVAALLKTDAAFLAITKGEPGKDAPALDEIVSVLVKEHADALRGEPGQDAPPYSIEIDDVAAALKADADFMALAKGEPGKDAPAVDLVLLSHEIVSRNATALRGEKGEKGDRGADVTPDEVAVALKCDPLFIAGIRGEPGPIGPGIEAPAWKKGVYREGTTVTHFFGRYYKAVQDTAAEPGDSPEWERIGNGGSRWMGVKNEKAVYENGDVFVEHGSCFMVLDGTPRMLAKRGSQGEKGDRGDKGEAGKAGPVPVHAEFKGGVLCVALSDGNVLEAPFDLAGIIPDQIALFKELIRQEKEADAERGGIALGRFFGTWSPNTQYQKGDVVNHQGAVFVCRNTSKGKNFVADKWERLN